ncbi:hypothetical protein [Clostridium hydrogeniformans]|uniref:hypothetical protein n=1 Tax=Clostridium hydrogeniformans TaxID=349933 RepID=UPI0004851C9A|nr:hypothetical protein [Clostridium hydrogeniformans]
MTQKKSNIKVLMGFVFSLLVLIGFNFPSYASASTLDIPMENLTLKDSGGENSWDKVNENGNIILNMNTNGLEKGYYTSQLYVNSEMDWSSYGEIGFYIKNLSDKPLRINLFIILKDGKYITLGEDSYVLLKKDNEKNMRLGNIEKGLIELDKSFQGRVHVPFQNFRISKEELGEIASYGITATTKENTIQKMEIGGVNLISSSDTYIPEDISSLKLIGDKTVMKPIVGESIEEYSLVINNEEGGEKNYRVYFSLNEEEKGISITEKGRLTVATDTTVDKVNIKSIIDNKVNIILEVSLKESSVRELKDVDGVSLLVPKTEEIKEVSNPKNILNNKYLIFIFRVIGILIVLVVSMFYFIWRRRWKKGL